MECDRPQRRRSVSLQVLEVDPERNEGEKRCARRSFDEAVSSVPVNRQDQGGRQRTVIQETLKTPRKFVADNRVDVLHVSRARGNPQNHSFLSQDTARAPCISTYATSSEEGKGVQICALEEGDTWMTPYRRYLAEGILPAEPEEGKKIKRNAARYTLVDGILFKHGFTHPILTCVSGDECTRIMVELHEGICGSVLL